jgi:hypothetical protein
MPSAEFAFRANSSKTSISFFKFCSSASNDVVSVSRFNISS